MDQSCERWQTWQGHVLIMSLDVADGAWERSLVQSWHALLRMPTGGRGTASPAGLMALVHPRGGQTPQVAACAEVLLGSRGP